MGMVRCIVAFALAGLLVAFPALAEEEEAPTPNDQAKAFAKDFKTGYKKMPIGDLLANVDRLIEFYKNQAVDDKRVRKDIMACMVKVAGMKDTEVVAHLMNKCKELDEEILDLVMDVLGRELKKRVSDDRVYQPAIEAIGKIHSENPKAIKTLTDLLKYKENDVVAMAAFALSHYEGTSGRVRKEIFEELLKQFEGVYNSSQANNENMKRKWTVTGEDVMIALNKLSVPPRTDADFPNPAVARTWFNDHKKESWDPED